MGDLEALNRNYETTYAAFENIPMIDEPPTSGLVLSDWEAFIQGWKDPETGLLHIAPVESLRIHNVDFLFRDFLQDEFKSLKNANAMLGTSYDHWDQIQPPQQDLHLMDFQSKTGALKWEYTVRNYLTVFDYIILRGRAIFNTVVYCAMAILSASKP